MSKFNALQIRTPEGIIFSQLLASPVTRALALLVDLAIVLAAVWVVGLVLALVGWLVPNLAGAVLLLLYFGLSIGYWMAGEWYGRGQTIGKRLLRLRVVDAGGLRLQFSQVAVRNLLRFADLLPGLYLVGGLACLFSRKAQRLGDFAANTVVIRAPKVVEPDLDHLVAGKFNSLRGHPHLEARLRQQVTPAEAAIAWQALARRDLLEAPARVELFATVAAHFREKVAFPPEATDGITDEQYVRNVVDLIYRPRQSPRPQPPSHGQPAPQPVR